MRKTEPSLSWFIVSVNRNHQIGISLLLSVYVPQAAHDVDVQSMTFLPSRRLRHEKLKPVKIDRGGPSEFQMLQCYDLEPTPQPTPPAFKVNREDPFDFYAD